MGRAGPIPAFPAPCSLQPRSPNRFLPPGTNFGAILEKAVPCPQPRPPLPVLRGRFAFPPPQSSALCGAHGGCHETPNWFRDINFTISLERFQSKGLCDMITRGDLSCICLMKQILCLMVLRGIKYSSAINQALLSGGGQEEEAGTQSFNASRGGWGATRRAVTYCRCFIIPFITVFL